MPLQCPSVAPGHGGETSAAEAGTGAHRTAPWIHHDPGHCFACLTSASTRPSTSTSLWTAGRALRPAGGVHAWVQRWRDRLFLFPPRVDASIPGRRVAGGVLSEVRKCCWNLLGQQWRDELHCLLPPKTKERSEKEREWKGEVCRGE